MLIANETCDVRSEARDFVTENALTSGASDEMGTVTDATSTCVSDVTLDCETAMPIFSTLTGEYLTYSGHVASLKSRDLQSFKIRFEFKSDNSDSV